MSASAANETTRPASGRDPFLDIIRAWAMIAVVANHTLYTVLSKQPSGRWELSMLQERGLAWVTWPFLWELPGFFLPAAALSFRAAQLGSARRFVSRRLWRLLVPVLPLAVGLVVLEVVMRSAGLGSCGSWNTALTCAAAMPLAPLWFLIVMIPLTAVSPWVARHWEGRGRWALPVVAVAVATLSDLSQAVFGAPFFPTEITVFGLVWFGGFAYASGDWDRITSRQWWTVTLVGAAAIVVLVVAGPYHARLGASPRTIVSVLELTVGVAMLMAARHWLISHRDHWLVGGGVRLIGDSTMGVFLWHYYAFGAVMGAAAVMGVDLATEVGLGYLAQRIVIIGLSLMLLAGLIRLVKPVERWPYPADRVRRTAKVAP